MITEIISSKVQFQYKLETPARRNIYGTMTVSKGEDPETIFFTRIRPQYSDIVVKLLSLNLIPHKKYLFVANGPHDALKALKISAMNTKDAYRCILERLNLSCTNLTASNFVLRLKERGFDEINFGTLLLTQP